MPGVRIAGLAQARPATTVTNADLLARGLDIDDAWVLARTGIRQRTVSPDLGVVGLATEAAGKALAASGVEGGDVDLWLLATTTMPTPIPQGAPQVAAALGGRGAALDLNAGCAGFCHALALGADAVRAGSARSVVVVGAERLSDWIDPHDRGTAVLFGDGAGALVLLADDDQERRDVGPVAWGSDGAAAGLIRVPERGGFVQMEGRAVYRWATGELTRHLRAACGQAGVDPADLDGVVVHQANLRIVDALVRSLGVDEARTLVSRDIVDTGNTSSASIPMALARMAGTGRLPPGARVLSFAFGAGLSYAGQVLTLP